MAGPLSSSEAPVILNAVKNGKLPVADVRNSWLTEYLANESGSAEPGLAEEKIFGAKPRNFGSESVGSFTVV